MFLSVFESDGSRLEGSLVWNSNAIWVLYSGLSVVPSSAKVKSLMDSLCADQDGSLWSQCILWAELLVL